ncbi:hypothetical protein K505DRAFT_333828 [Melanomma pulvis-pyrius CBS 109.77]|uniref:Uncharacterized protein n=1 Tax=Melanomma pulvis-pyrius CBS 109.77 TaxID=1314802 RepID=A0A6A6XNU9_9PLEO|nr:hypothetical protein K505DRAFT_333828 [Melanomma pulvis-pyrius CBS 109.77]
MCYEAEDLSRIGKEVRNEVNPEKRYKIFINGVRGLDRNCQKCRMRREQQEADEMEKTRRRNAKFHEFTITQLGIKMPTIVSDYPISSSKSQTPPHQRAVERFSPYPTPRHQTHPPQDLFAGSSQPLHFNKFPAKQTAPPLSSNPSQNPSPTSTRLPHTSESKYNQKAKPKTASQSSFERWFQNIDNPSS